MFPAWVGRWGREGCDDGYVGWAGADVERLVARYECGYELVDAIADADLPVGIGSAWLDVVDGGLRYCPLLGLLRSGLNVRSAVLTLTLDFLLFVLFPITRWDFPRVPLWTPVERLVFSVWTATPGMLLLVLVSALSS